MDPKAAAGSVVFHLNVNTPESRGNDPDTETDGSDIKTECLELKKGIEIDGAGVKLVERNGTGHAVVEVAPRNDRTPSRYDRATFCARVFYSFARPILDLGKRRPLTDADLEDLPDHDHAEVRSV